jgi:UDP-N-acetylmuramoyl-L-alanyl-D-glutamate--2,6-diaminopimelate ligase
MLIKHSVSYTHYADFLVAAKGKEIIDFGLDDFNDIRPTEQGFLVTLQHHIFPASSRL